VSFFYILFFEGKEFIVKTRREQPKSLLKPIEIGCCGSTESKTFPAVQTRPLQAPGLTQRSSFQSFFKADARKNALAENSIDLILTSPAYWQKRDYEVKKQLGQEKTVRGYVSAFMKIMNGWKPILKKSGSVFSTLVILIKMAVCLKFRV
jgi:hypothetical protein